MGATALFLVNGTPRVAPLDTWGRGQAALSKGKLQLQSEAAEVFYRKIERCKIESFLAHLQS